MSDSLLRATPTDFELRLSGTAPADAAGVPRERVVFLAESGQAVLQLREFDLQLAVAALGALREDVEDELRAIEHLQIAYFGDGCALGGGQVRVEDECLGAELHGANDDVVELATAEDELGVAAIARRDD